MSPKRVHIDDLLGNDIDSQFDLYNLKEINEIDIILGFDLPTQTAFVVEGRDQLNNLLAESESRLVDVLVVELDRRSDDLNRLKTFVQLAKHRAISSTRREPSQGSLSTRQNEVFRHPV